MTQLNGHYLDGSRWRTARKAWKCRSQQLVGRVYHGHTPDIAVGDVHLEVLYDSVLWSRNPSRMCRACAEAVNGEVAVDLMFGRIPYKWERPNDVIPDWAR